MMNNKNLLNKEATEEVADIELDTKKLLLRQAILANKLAHWVGHTEDYLSEELKQEIREFLWSIGLNNTDNLEKAVFRIKDMVLQVLIDHYREDIELTYLVDFSNSMVPKNARTQCKIMEYYWSNKDAYYYDLLEIKIKEEEREYIFHALPWNLRWGRVSAVKIREYWFSDSELYEDIQIALEQDSAELLNEKVSEIFSKLRQLFNTK